MAEADPVGGHAQQARRLGRLDRGRPDAQLGGSAEHAGPVAGVVGSGKQQQPLAGRGQAAGAGEECVLQRRCQRYQRAERPRELLTAGLGWRWILFVNVPIGIGCALAAPRLIAESRAPRAGQGFDVAGAVAITGGLGALVYGLVGASRAGWLSPRTAGSLAAAAVLLAAFVVIERRAGSPLVPFGIFRLTMLRAANLTMLLTGAAVLSLFFILSLYEQQVLRYTALQAGLSQLPLAITTIATAGLASRLVSLAGVKVTLAGGLALFAAGLAWLAQVTASSSFAAGILGPSLLVGAGLGLAFVSLTIGAVSGVPGSQAGLASGLINSSQQIGGALGLAIAATIAAARTSQSLASGIPAGTALTAGFRLAFLAAAVFAALGMVTALTLTGRSPAAGNSGDIPAHAEEELR